MTGGRSFVRPAVGLMALSLFGTFGLGGAAVAQTQPPQVVPVIAGPTSVAPKVLVAVDATDALGELKTPKYSDPLADIAAVALGALKARPAGPAGPVSVVSTVPTNVVPIALAAQTQVVSPSAATTSSGGQWSSVTLDTANLSDYFAGSRVDVPIAPQTQAILAKLPEGESRYGSALRQVALNVAGRIKGAKAAELEAVWLKTDDRRMTAVLTALAQVGTMYRYTGNQPGGFDCSGLTSYAWAQAGVKIPRISGDQIEAARSKSPAELLPGDLIWRPGHIGMYLGLNDFMVHSPQTGKPVAVRTWGKTARFGSPI